MSKINHFIVNHAAFLGIDDLPEKLPDCLTVKRTPSLKNIGYGRHRLILSVDSECSDDYARHAALVFHHSHWRLPGRYFNSNELPTVFNTLSYLLNEYLPETKTDPSFAVRRYWPYTSRYPVTLPMSLLSMAANTGHPRETVAVRKALLECHPGWQEPLREIWLTRTPASLSPSQLYDDETLDAEARAPLFQELIHLEEISKNNAARLLHMAVFGWVRCDQHVTGLIKKSGLTLDTPLPNDMRVGSDTTVGDSLDRNIMTADNTDLGKKWIHELLTRRLTNRAPVREHAIMPSP